MQGGLAYRSPFRFATRRRCGVASRSCASVKHAQGISGQLDLDCDASVEGQRLAVALDQGLKRLTRRQADHHTSRTSQVDQPFDLARHTVLAARITLPNPHSLRPNDALDGSA
jgi:hypothetical protein